MVLFIAADVSLSGRREHRGPRGARAYRALALRAQPRAAQRAALRGRALRGAHAAPVGAPRARAAGPAPPAAAAAARAGIVRGNGARHRHRQRVGRRERVARRPAGAVLAQRAAALGAAQQLRQAAPCRHPVQGGGLDNATTITRTSIDFNTRSRLIYKRF